MNQDFVRLKSIKPAMTEYIRNSLVLLKRSPVPDEKAVHDIRVLMKKARAVLRLISGQIEKESYEREYDTYREAGRILRDWRESSVHRKLLKDLRKRHPDAFDMAGSSERLALLTSKSEPEAEPGEEMKANTEILDELLSKAGYRLRFLPLETLNPQQLLSQLDLSYKTVSQAYIKCRHAVTPANVHEFRKRAKDLLYQLWFFRPLDPSSVKNMEKRLDALTQNLGKFNDLAVLLDALQYKYGGLENPSVLDDIALIVREEQDRYLARVWSPAYKMFRPGQNLVGLLGFKILIL